VLPASNAEPSGLNAAVGIDADRGVMVWVAGTIVTEAAGAAPGKEGMTREP
jgi:hypothetical protein